MIATHGQVVPHGVRVDAALDLAHAAPLNLSRVAVLLVARDHTALATDALRHIQVEAILLAG
jgi:hypothetical protein